ncbi:S8 family serine peptidase [Natrinema versiforme]|uniref:Peptidase S8 and S53 subtilisin kexin sedolisin n=1 Tax=Natrinema versiforme JCM 10478 TaxID=1227496 RepID=L9Y137_9EURY|nr:S8 family serine peptidase [Natrinema versiforme]ELY67809.1 peptidase S8 and S53 subtilisin kexin sedolisin [Natrinema versiforme JCM 10478]
MASDRFGPVSLSVLAVVAALLFASVLAPVALGAEAGVDAESQSTTADDSIVIDEDLPENGTTVDVVVRLEEATVPETATDGAAERRFETHAETTQDPLLDYVRKTEGVSIEETFWLTNAVLITVDTSEVEYETFERFDAVEAVHENFAVTVPDPPTRANATASATASSPTAAERRTTNGLAQLNASPVWDAYDARGEGVRVAVLDTGIDVDHPDLELATDDPSDPTYPGGWAEFNATGQRVAGSTPHDTGTHGTHVSGTVAGGATTGTAIGVAPEVELLHGLVLSDTSGSFAQIVAGMEWAVREDADVINLSLGATGKHSQFIDPVRNARESGAIVVAAIGNEGAETSGSPGNVYESVSVGAVDRNGAVPTFSGGQRVNRTEWARAPDDWAAPPSYVVPDVVAPGVAITSAVPDGGYESMPGTSMATPHVSGTAALLLSIEPDATPEEIEAVLTETARVPEGYTTDSETAGVDGDLVDTRYGYGIVDASAAADALVAARTSIEPVTADEPTDDPSASTDLGPPSSPVLVGSVVVVAVGLGVALLATRRGRHGGR